MIATEVTLRRRAEDYLAVRRVLGYKLAENEILLRQFLDYLERSDATTVTTAAAVAWAIATPGAPRAGIGGVCRWYGASPVTSTLWTPAAKCLRPGCCVVSRIALSRISIPRRRSTL